MARSMAAGGLPPTKVPPTVNIRVVTPAKSRFTFIMSLREHFAVAKIAVPRRSNPQQGVSDQDALYNSMLQKN